MRSNTPCARGPTNYIRFGGSRELQIPPPCGCGWVRLKNLGLRSSGTLEFKDWRVWRLEVTNVSRRFGVRVFGVRSFEITSSTVKVIPGSYVSESSEFEVCSLLRRSELAILYSTLDRDGSAD